MGDGAGNEAGAETQLVRGETAGFTGRSFIHAGDFIKDVSRKNHGNPKFRGAFTFTHSCFWRTSSNWLMRKDTDENLAFTLEETGDGNSASFDLIVFKPAAVKHLETKVTKVQFVGTGGITTAVAALGFAIFYSTGKKGHGSILGIRFLIKGRGKQLFGYGNISDFSRRCDVSGRYAGVALGALTTAGWTSAVITALTTTLLTRSCIFTSRATVQPDFNADDTINSASFSEAVVDRDTEGLERNFAKTIPLCTGDISTAQATSDSNSNAVCTEFHGGLHRTLHGTAERNSTLKLNSDTFCDKLGIHFWLLDLEDVDLHLFAAAHFGDLLAHHLDFLTLASDNEAWACCVERDTNLIPCSLDDDLGESGLHEFRLQEITDGDVGVQGFCEFLASGEPLGAPVFTDCEAEADRINFLSHRCVE
jgi:hypothetical protein